MSDEGWSRFRAPMAIAQECIASLANNLVYEVFEDKIRILACRYHY